ncbi:unnamed protein product [Didymodactylos carnosus]|uniref:RecF/RecN/SMC N-terminal domain-containing protein n=1 Tax=Didymodactylos carnosus TaxID=1234261 RepID=A0A8S2HZ15_9BILA|nr:unnamed protein product [Didymodactylos carnosus]CAF3698259.1 unnamed protein product [Didymodactylos carnosus]
MMAYDAADTEEVIDIENLELPPLPDHIQALLTPTFRLVINQIEINNFKSFAGNIRLDQFDQHFTCIIGPNGSGKSNVIDSLLFVIGHRASKLRGTKLSTLLHKSADHPNVQSCSVTVYFDAISIDGTEEQIHFSIARIAYIDNSSQYKINEKQVHLKDVTTLLRKYGVDLDHSRYLILQGDVESIALMKPIAPNEHEQGFLEYLEDIIGTERFKKPLELINQKLEELNALWAEKKNRVKVAENELKSLEEPYRAAVEWIECENEYKRTKSIFCQLKRYQLKDKETDLNLKHTERQTEIDKFKMDFDDKKQLCKQSQDELKQQQRSYDKNQTELNKVKKWIEDHENEDKTIRHDIKTCLDAIKRHEKQNETETTKIRTLETIPEEKEEYIKETQAELDQVREEQKALEIKVNKIRDDLLPKTEQWRKESTKKQQDFVDYKQQMLQPKKEHFELAQNQLKMLLSEEERHKKSLNDKEIEYNRKQKEFDDKTQRFEIIDEQLPLAENEYKTKYDESKRIETQYQQLETEHNKNVAELNDLSQRVQTSQSRDQTLNFLLQQKQANKLDGFHTCLGHLGHIDEKYDVAISTAIGGYLDYRVVTFNGEII